MTFKMKIKKIFNNYIIPDKNLKKIIEMFNSSDKESRLLGIELFKSEIGIIPKIIKKTKPIQLIKGDKFAMSGIGTRPNGEEYDCILECTVITNNNGKLLYSFKGNSKEHVSDYDYIYNNPKFMIYDN